MAFHAHIIQSFLKSRLDDSALTNNFLYHGRTCGMSEGRRDYL